jgi:hypothetical protein
MILLDEYIFDMKNHGYTQTKFNDFVIKSGGFDKLKKKDLDTMINELSGETICVDSFMDIYKLVSENEYGFRIKV